MSLPFRFDDLSERFSVVRPWAKTAVGDTLNRCAVCMAYTLQISPSPGDASLASLGSDIQKSVAAAGRVARGPSPISARDPYTGLFFIRASELFPRIKRAFGEPDISGESSSIWPQVVGRKGVMYLEKCYQTEGDKRLSKIPWLYSPMSGGHWDLFDGYLMVAEKHPIANNTHTGTMNFWIAR